MKTFTALLLLLTAIGLQAQPPNNAQPAKTEKLEYVVYFSRHGVRTPLTTNPNLNNLSVDPWPDWKIPIGDMTAHGRTLMQLIGAYDREYFTHAGLLSSDPCADAKRFYFWADNIQRDIESARAIDEKMFPGCTVPVGFVDPKLKDPIFAATTAPRAPGIEAFDRKFGTAALAGRIGDDPHALLAGHSAEVDFLQRILLACDPAGPCPKNGRTPKRMLLDAVPQPAPPAAPRDHLAELTALSGQFGSVAEALYLEYVDGMPMKDVGWGRIDRAGIERLMAVRAANIDITQRTPYQAQTHASNLLSHIVRSLEQSTGKKTLRGALGHAGDKGLFILGHDGDIVPLGAVLGASWLTEGYGANDTPPGTAMVFEMWRDTLTNKRSIRTWLMTETAEKMRDAVPLSLQSPPTRIAIFVPGCSTPAEGYPCDWEAFQKVAEAALDPRFVAKGFVAKGFVAKEK